MSIINRAAGIFGRMGQNPSINALTNANAIANQQQVMGNATMATPDTSQQIMTGSFDPLTQQVGMGIFGDQNARNMAVRGSGLMKHDELGKQLKDLQVRKQELIEKFGPDSDPVMEQESRIMDKKKDIEAAEKAHNSPAQTRGETYEEFKKRTGETSMKAYMRDNPTGSKK